MISIYRNKNVEATENGEKKAIEFRGLSTDTKPTQVYGKDVSNGAVFIEIDTGKVFLFDLDSKEWKEV